MAYPSLWRDLLRYLGAGVRHGMARVPSNCPLCGCGARGGLLCVECGAWVLSSMRSSAPRCSVCCVLLDSSAVCLDCGFLTPAFERVVAAFDYAEPGDLLIHRLKAMRQFALAPMLAGLLADAVRQSAPALPGNTILVSVPSSGASVARRGFNPAAEVARALAAELRLSYQPRLLRRTHEGARQAQSSRAERARGVHTLYACTRHVGGASIGVVDDVLTTGSTLDSIARQFRAAGALSVYGLVVARTPVPQRPDTPS